MLHNIRTADHPDGSWSDYPVQDSRVVLVNERTAFERAASDLIAMYFPVRTPADRDWHKVKPGQFPSMENYREYTPEDTDLLVISFDTPDARRPGQRKYWLQMFKGKQSRPFYYHTLGSEAEMQRTIDGYVRGAKASAKRKQEDAQARREYRHTLKVGDILVSSWGYDQTNTDFFKVVALKGEKMILLQEIGSKVVDESGGGYTTVVPDPRREIGNILSRNVGQGNHVRINSSSTASPWDGKPQYETALGWGH